MTALAKITGGVIERKTNFTFSLYFMEVWNETRK
uniref:Uncharacterized protein n=1 Tax=Siphoviridae sp. ctWT735 TaxID=2825538 RepID=A0A8S5TU45_9CAUD|nr:MAG TPA: hypothetical protein [Siphoviridae sp. ctWT735]